MHSGFRIQAVLNAGVAFQKTGRETRQSQSLNRNTPISTLQGLSSIGPSSLTPRGDA